MTRVTRLVGGGSAALLIAPWLGGVVANASSDSPPPSGDPRATSVSGNATTCGDVGFPNDTQFGALDSSGKTGDGFTVTSDGQNLTVAAIPAGTTIDVLIVKGGDAYNVYPSSTFAALPATGLHSPLVGNGNIAVVSHWFLCYGPTPPQVTPPSATSTGDCDGADLTLNAGTLPTVFTVTRAGDTTGQTYALAGGASQVVHVSLDATHSSVTADTGGPALTTFLRDNAICDRTDGGGDNGSGGDTGNTGNGGGDTGNTGGDTGNSGGDTGNNGTGSGDTGNTGGTTNTGGGTVDTGGGTTAGGGTTTGGGTAAGGGTTTSGGTTGTASGVAVLGVKHVRHQTTHKRTRAERTNVLGSSASLPFTGFNARRVAVDGALTIGIGLALCLVAGRRPQPAAARRRR